MRGFSLTGSGAVVYPPVSLQISHCFQDPLLLLRYGHRGRLDMNVLHIFLLLLFPFPVPTLLNACIILLSYCTSASLSYISPFSSFSISSSMSSSYLSPPFFLTSLPHLLLSSSVNVQKALSLTWIQPGVVERMTFPQERQHLSGKYPD